MNKRALLIGAILGLLSVLIGAFGAHGLKETLTQNGKLDVFETAVKYQFFHALALLIVGILMEKIKDKLMIWSRNSFFSGVLIFSGSLYVLSLLNVSWLGAITPIGGLFLLFGWVFLIVSIYKEIK